MQLPALVVEADGVDARRECGHLGQGEIRPDDCATESGRSPRAPSLLSASSACPCEHGWSRRARGSGSRQRSRRRAGSRRPSPPSLDPWSVPPPRPRRGMDPKEVRRPAHRPGRLESGEVRVVRDPHHHGRLDVTEHRLAVHAAPETARCPSPRSYNRSTSRGFMHVDSLKLIATCLGRLRSGATPTSAGVCAVDAPVVAAMVWREAALQRRASSCSGEAESTTPSSRRAGQT